MRVALAGLGVVGRSLLELVRDRREELLKAYGLNPRFVAVADKSGAVARATGISPHEILEQKRRGGITGMEGAEVKSGTLLDLLGELDIDVYIDATPTNIVDGEPSYSLIRKAILARADVITVNKGPLALAFPAIRELAERRGVIFRFSGTVGGGMPVLEFAKECARADTIVAIEGVLNGTTNFILTRMEEEGLDFPTALKQAQELGYAERDPTLDIKGLDTACKITILANAVLGMKVTLHDVEVVGIDGVAREDIVDALKSGEVIRLIGRAGRRLSVMPERIPKGDTLNVKEAMNAVRFTTQYSGRHTITGKGAGGYETATAILRDLISIKQRRLVET